MTMTMFEDCTEEESKIMMIFKQTYDNEKPQVVKKKKKDNSNIK